ncbi:MAG: hypothetical protein ACRDPY_38270 [Streptosporangiaceae bacterium]
MPAGAARRPAAPAPRRAAGPASVTTAAAARARQLAAQAEHRQAVAEFRARRAADQQARINALLQEAIAALAGLPGMQQPATPQPPPVPRRPIQTAPRGHLPATGRAQILTAALAGLELGAWDRRILHWLAGRDTSTVLTVASWITRARATTASQQPQP